VRRSLRLLLLASVAAVAVPAVPLLFLGSRLDQAVIRFLNPPPPPGLLAAAEVAILAADLVLPVPSSFVATLGGAVLGVPLGSLCGWLGMTLSALAGWAVGRLAGRTAVEALPAEERGFLEHRRQQIGPALIILTRPVPLLAEALSIAAGGLGMPRRSFLLSAAAGNLAIAVAWSLAGAVGNDRGTLEWFLVGSLMLPVAMTALLCTTFLPRSPHENSRQS
jgi:uncharacterized membrane protein YdjX (TVP38/TMEM64 family)